MQTKQFLLGALISASVLTTACKKPEVATETPPNPLAGTCQVTELRDLNGKITNRQAFDSEGNVTEITYYDSKERKTSLARLTYTDKRLSLVNSTGYDTLGIVKSNNSFTVLYNAAGKIERQNSSDGSYTTRNYDASNRLTRVSEYNTTGVQTYYTQYDYVGTEPYYTTVRSFDQTGAATNRTELTRDAKGWVTNLRRYNSSSVITSSTAYQYDTKKTLIYINKIPGYYPEGVPAVSPFYDGPFGNLINETYNSYDATGTLTNTSTTTYTYTYNTTSYPTRAVRSRVGSTDSGYNAVYSCQ